MPSCSAVQSEPPRPMNSPRKVQKFSCPAGRSPIWKPWPSKVTFFDGSNDNLVVGKAKAVSQSPWRPVTSITMEHQISPLPTCWTQSEAANHLGVTPAYLKFLEHGKGHLTSKLVRRGLSRSVYGLCARFFPSPIMRMDVEATDDACINAFRSHQRMKARASKSPSALAINGN